MPFNLSLLEDQQYQQDQQDQQDQQTIPFNVCSMIPANSAGIINVSVDPNTNLCNIDDIQIQNILGNDYFQQSRDLFFNNSGREKLQSQQNIQHSSWNINLPLTSKLYFGI